MLSLVSRYPCPQCHGYKTPETKGAGWFSLLAERGHQSPEPCEGGVEYDTSEGRVWFRQRPPDNDQGTFLPIVRLQAGFTPIQDSMGNEVDYVNLGLACADVCRALDRGLNGRQVDELNQSVFEAIGQLTT